MIFECFDIKVSIVIRSANQHYVRQPIGIHHQQQRVSESIGAEWKMAVVIASIFLKSQTSYFDAMSVDVFGTAVNAECAKPKEKKRSN